jgi:hypothetical protein
VTRRGDEWGKPAIELNGVVVHGDGRAAPLISGDHTERRETKKLWCESHKRKQTKYCKRRKDPLGIFAAVETLSEILSLSAYILERL